MCSCLCIPQRNVTFISCRRKATSVWRYCKRCSPPLQTNTLVASVIESIVSTSHISITILLPALVPKVYFTQKWCPLPPCSSHHSHRTPVHPIQCSILWHSKNRTIDILRSVHESISTLQEPSVSIVEQLCRLVVQFLLCLHQLVVSHRTVESMHTYCPPMRVSHHQNCPWHLSQQAHGLHPV